jgi:hypothetical protein
VGDSFAMGLSDVCVFVTCKKNRRRFSATPILNTSRQPWERFDRAGPGNLMIDERLAKQTVHFNTLRFARPCLLVT